MNRRKQRTATTCCWLGSNLYIRYTLEIQPTINKIVLAFACSLPQRAWEMASTFLGDIKQSTRHTHLPCSSPEAIFSHHASNQCIRSGSDGNGKDSRQILSMVNERVFCVENYIDIWHDKGIHLDGGHVWNTKDRSHSHKEVQNMFKAGDVGACGSASTDATTEEEAVLPFNCTNSTNTKITHIVHSRRRRCLWNGVLCAFKYLNLYHDHSTLCLCWKTTAYRFPSTVNADAGAYYRAALLVGFITFCEGHRAQWTRLNLDTYTLYWMIV